MKFGSLAAVLLGGVALFVTTSANAGTSVSVSIGSVGVTATDGCDDYYDGPGGYPDDYCDYDVWDEPVYIGGSWYQGPVYWRWDNGVRVFWWHGRWRRDEWVGVRPAHFAWGTHGFVTWVGKSHGGHVWVAGGHNNWHPHWGHDHHGHDHHGDHDHHGHDHHDDHDHHGHDHHDDHDHHGHDHHDGHDHHGHDDDHDHHGHDDHDHHGHDDHDHHGHDDHGHHGHDDHDHHGHDHHGHDHHDDDHH